MGSYVPVTPEERRAMLERIGLPSVEALYADVPEGVLLKEPPVFTGGFSELEVRRHMERLAEQNRVFSTILRGAGEHPLSVFIYADPADRTRRIAARNGLDERRAMHRAQKIDRMRKHHFDFYADTLWGEPASYDLMLSSSEYGITGAAEVIAAAARAGK